MSYLTDGSHALVFGISGQNTRFGGKTGIAHWWLRESIRMGWTDLALFFNAKPTTYIGGTVRGQEMPTVSTLEGLAKSYQAGHRIFDFRPKSITGEKEHQAVVDLMFRLPGEKIMVHDEADDYMGQSLHRAVKRGSGADMKNLVLLQRAWDAHEGVRTQAPLTVYVGPYADGYDRFFSSELGGSAYEAADGTPVTPREHIQRNHEPYEWSVFDADGSLIDYNGPVDERYAE